MINRDVLELYSLIIHSQFLEFAIAKICSKTSCVVPGVVLYCQSEMNRHDKIRVSLCHVSRDRVEKWVSSK